LRLFISDTSGNVVKSKDILDSTFVLLICVDATEAFGELSGRNSQNDKRKKPENLVKIQTGIFVSVRNTVQTFEVFE
jgi:hypothetical protein